MKKKKAPIFPILLVIFLLGWVGYSQIPRGRPDAPKQEDSKAGEVAKGVSDMVKQDKTKAPEEAPLRTVQTSSLLRMPEANMKPKPNPTSTSSQWYEKESAQIVGN